MAQTPAELKAALAKQEKFALENQTGVRDLAFIPERDGEQVPAQPPYHRSEKLWAAMEIAKATLNSPRHQTLNAGFAQQCVAFVEFMETASGQRFDPD